MHEMPDASQSSPPQDAPAVPGAPDALVSAWGAARDGAGRVAASDGVVSRAPDEPPDSVADLPLVALPPSWVKARQQAHVVRPWPSAVWPRAWSSVAAWLAALAVLAVVLVPVPPSVTDLYAAAASARASWRYDRALAFYTQAARQDPTDPRAHCLIGQVLTLQQLYTQAVAAYNDCQRLGDHSGGVWLALGDIARDRDDTAGAERAWLRAAALGSPTARERLGLLYEAESQFDLAQAQWRQLPASDVTAHIHLGLLALRTGDYDTARAEFVAARELPGFGAQAVADQGFVQIAAVGPTDPASLTALGAAFIQANMPAFARLPVQRALALSPGSGPAHAELAWVERLAGETAAARADSAAALRETPLDSFALFVAAELALDVRQWSTGVHLLDQALQTDGNNGALWAERGRAEVELRDYLHAELSYQQAEQVGDNAVYGQLFLDFYVQFRIGLDDGRALDAAVQAVRRWPADAGVWELAGQLYELSGQVDLAQQAYERANQFDPSQPRSYLDLGRLAFNSQQFVVAARDLRTGLALQPEGPLASQFRAFLVVLANYDV